LETAYGRAGKSFNGQLQQNFVVLNERDQIQLQSVARSSTRSTPAGGSGGSGASGATGGVNPNLQTVTVSSGSATFDWSLGSNGFIQSGTESNYTLSMSNFPTASNSAYDLTILYEQNTPGAYAEQMNIGGNTVTRFCFSNDTTPSTVDFNWEIQKFKIFYFSSSNIIVLSVLETYCSNSNAPPPE